MHHIFHVLRRLDLSRLSCMSGPRTQIPGYGYVRASKKIYLRPWMHDTKFSDLKEPNANCFYKLHRLIILLEIS